MFGTTVTVTEKGDPGTTGNFEITNDANSKLIWSKKEKGDGICKSEEQHEALFVLLEGEGGKRQPDAKVLPAAAGGCNLL